MTPHLADASSVLQYIQDGIGEVQARLENEGASGINDDEALGLSIDTLRSIWEVLNDYKAGIAKVVKASNG